MKKYISLIFCLFFALSTLSADIVVKKISGRKVKVKISKNDSWSRIKEGDILFSNSIISTGFNTKVVLDLGHATLDVFPLTRMTVKEITKSNENISTSLFLQGGKIKADVKKSVRQDFQIKSPVATASVRGTSFLFTGNTLYVDRGIVDFAATSKYTPEDAGISPEPGDVEEEDAEILGGTSKLVRVRAGGLTKMASITVNPVKPEVLKKEVTSVSVSTKPQVIKDSIVEGLQGIVSPEEIPTVADIEQAVITTSLITIEIPVIIEQ